MTLAAAQLRQVKKSAWQSRIPILLNPIQSNPITSNPKGASVPPMFVLEQARETLTNIYFCSTARKATVGGFRAFIFGRRTVPPPVSQAQ